MYARCVTWAQQNNRYIFFLSFCSFIVCSLTREPTHMNKMLSKRNVSFFLSFPISLIFSTLPCNATPSMSLVFLSRGFFPPPLSLSVYSSIIPSTTKILKHQNTYKRHKSILLYTEWQRLWRWDNSWVGDNIIDSIMLYKRHASKTKRTESLSLKGARRLCPKWWTSP